MSEPEFDFDPAEVGYYLMDLMGLTKTLGHATAKGTCIPYVHRDELPAVEARFVWDVITSNGSVALIEERWPGLLDQVQAQQVKILNEMLP